MVRRYIKNSLVRGCVQMVRRPMYILLMVIMPLLCAWFLMDLMKTGSVERVPVGIVDLDDSGISRQVSRRLGAFQQVDIKWRYHNFEDARQALMRGDIYGFFFIPEDFEESALGGRQPMLSYYVNYAYYAPASMQFKGFKTISVLGNAGVVQTMLRMVGMRDGEIMSALQPVSTHVHMLSNPFTNYNFYLSTSFVPCFFALFVLLVTAFSIGMELKSGLCRQWLRTSGNDMWLAIVGKLLPQLLLFTVVGWTIQFMMYRVYDLPLNCPPSHMLLAMPLFVLANQGFAVMMFCVAPNFRYGTTVCTLLGMLSFSFCGFSLPAESIYPWVQSISYIVPVKYYFMLSVDQAVNGLDLYYSRYYYVALIVFAVAPFLLLWRLKRECENPVYVP